MKTRIFLLSLLLLISSISYSQILKGISLKSGVSLSNQKWEFSYMGNEIIYNIKPGLYSALSLDFINKNYWELSADIGFYKSINKTAVNPYYYFYNTHEEPQDLNFRFGFLTLSPVLKLKTTINSFTPYILFGPRIDYFVSELSSDEAKSFENDINKTLFGFNIGEGVAYNFNNFSVFAEYQFFYTFTKLIDKPAISPTLTFSRDLIKFNTHIISLGLKYHFTKAE